MRTTIAALFLLSLSAAAAQAQFGVYTFSATDKQAGSVNGFVAFVDATMTNISPVATAKLPLTDPCTMQGFPVRLTTTIQFAAGLHAPFAVNANLGPGLSDPIYLQRPCGTPYGLLKNAGAYLAAVDQLGSLLTYGPSLIFPKNSLPAIGPSNPVQSITATTAIAGWIGGQGCVMQPGTPLVAGAVNQGITAQPVPTTPAPRTGVGIDATGQVLMFIVVNGNESNGQGLTLPDFADLFIAFGAENAINLDGGGSSTFAWNPAAISNQPSQLVKTVVDNVKSSYGSISMVTLQNTTTSPCYSYPHALPAGCQSKPVNDPNHPYRPIYASFAYVAVSSGKASGSHPAQ